MQITPDSIDLVEEERKKRRRKIWLLSFLLFAHMDFFLAQAFRLPLSLEQLFAFGHMLIVADTALGAFLIVKLFRREPGRQQKIL